MLIANHQLRGIILILTAAVLWGTTGTAQTFAPLTLSSYWVGAIRLLVAGGFFVLWLGVRDIRQFSVARLQALPWSMILIAALGITTYNLAFFAGVRSTSVAIGTAIALGSGPVWAGILQSTIYRRMPPGGWWIALTICVTGLVLTTTGSEDSIDLTVQGVSLCLLSGLAYAVYALATKQIVTNASASVATTAVFVLAAAVAAPVAWALTGQPVIGTTDVAVVLWLGLVATGIAYLLFSTGLQFVSSSTGVALALAEPIAAVCLAILVVGERPSGLSLAGLAMLLVGLALIVHQEFSTDFS